MRLLPKSIHRCRRYPTKFNSGRDIPDREPAPVVVRETETLAPKPGSEHTVLLLQIVDHILLLAVAPAS